MYLRHTTLRKDGKVHRYWRLVRSVRVGRKVIQQTVAHLGELDPEGRARAKALARAITGDREQSDLFEPGVAEEAIPVRLKRIRLERGRRFGDVWLGWTLWRALHLDEVLKRLLPEGREAVPWSTVAPVLALASLCEPSSELHIAEDWYRRTALEDLLALPAPLVNDDRLYRALDRLLPHKRTLEQHLVARLGELFALDYELLLYDVTSTYFEGLAESNPLAQRGYSRDHRPDCKQVCLALVVTRDGMPLGYEVFAGNRTDVTTVEEIVEAMEARYGVAERIWVMDRGMTSEDNLEWLRESGRRYLVGTPKTELRKWARQIADARDWHAVRDGIEAKQCVGPEGTETFVLVRSIERREKERAMHERFCRRIEAGPEPLGQRGARAPVAHLHPAHRRRGGGSHPEERAGAAPDLASAGGPSRGAHPGLLPRLCALENARAVAATRWARAQPAHRPRGAAADSEHRRRASDRRRARDSTALRGASGRRAGRAPRSPRSRASRTPADPAPATRTRPDVVPTFLVSARKVGSDPLELRKLG